MWHPIEKEIIQHKIHFLEFFSKKALCELTKLYSLTTLQIDVTPQNSKKPQISEIPDTFPQYTNLKTKTVCENI